MKHMRILIAVVTTSTCAFRESPQSVTAQAVHVRGAWKLLAGLCLHSLDAPFTSLRLDRT
jgi:hypothetical protein